MIKKEKLIGNLATQLPPRARLKKKIVLPWLFPEKI